MPLGGAHVGHRLNGLVLGRQHGRERLGAGPDLGVGERAHRNAIVRAKSPARSVHQSNGLEAGGGQLGLEALTPELGADLGAQLLARGEVDGEPEAADGHLLGRVGAQAHLDPLVVGVPQRHVLEGVVVEVGVEPVVEGEQHVAVEVGRDARRVVVGGHDPLRVLHDVGAEQQAVARLEHPRDGCEEAGALVREQVADGAAEEGHEARPTGRQPVDVVLEVAHDAQDLGVAVLRGERREGVAQGGLADVEADVLLERAGRLHGVEEDAGLVARAGAQLDERGGAAGLGDDHAVGGEDLALGAGGVVLGQAGDLVEQRRATVVVEPLGRQRLGRRGEPGERVGPHGLLGLAGREVDIDARKRCGGGVGGHDSPRGSRRQMTRVQQNAGGLSC